MNRPGGEVALGSGAGRGIGAGTARLMVDAGAKVAIGDVLDERGRETARALGEAAFYVHLDVTSEADWQAAIDAVLGRWGGSTSSLTMPVCFSARTSKRRRSTNGIACAPSI